jgi:glucose-6-phosphate 1-epimerase
MSISLKTSVPKGTVTAMSPTNLANRFDIRDAIRVESVPGGLERVTISTSAAEAELHLQGAHLARWTPRGHRPVLFLSPKSLFATGKAIRGGVPVIFPWFGSRSDGKPGPQHGFARTSQWTVEDARQLEAARVEIALTLGSSDATRQLFDGYFQLRLRAIIGPELEMDLETFNESNAPFTFEEALHTYLAVGDVQQVSVSGLEGTTFIDKTDGFKRKKQGDEALRIAKETDQVHLSAQAACMILDPVWNRRIVIEKSGSNSTVIWNPWAEKSKGMSDMAADGWKQMICVETANAADNSVTLAPGASHKLSAKIRIEVA